MKASNIFLLILTSIITFIGLCLNKLYEKYVKQNWLVQGALYCFWTILVLRLLYWVAKPILNINFSKLLSYVPHISINITEVTPTVALVIFLVGLTITTVIMKSAIKSIK